MVKKMKLTQRKSSALFVAVTTFALCTLLPMLSKAQTGFDVDSTGGGGGGDIVDVPLDNGTILLLCAGVGFGIYKLYKIAQERAVTSN